MTAPRAMTLAALFVTGSIAGAAAVTLASNASDAPPTLIAGPVSYVDYEQSADGLVSLTVEKFNASERAVPVAVTSIAGWLVSISDANTPVVHQVHGLSWRSPQQPIAMWSGPMPLRSTRALTSWP